MNNDTDHLTSDGRPPGHPAGTDEFVSSGEVLSGRGMGTGGVLGTQSRSQPSDGEAPDDAAGPPAGPTVLVAVDGDSLSERVVRTAHRLFGDTAVYLAIDVGAGPHTELGWSYVWPVAGASIWTPHVGVADLIGESSGAHTARDAAESVAEQAARRAGLAGATSIGDIGDTTSAILRAAHHHHADVVVIGADRRGWFSHLFDADVEHELLDEGDFALLVVTEGSGPRPDQIDS